MLSKCLHCINNNYKPAISLSPLLPSLPLVTLAPSLLPSLPPCYPRSLLVTLSHSVPRSLLVTLSHSAPPPSSISLTFDSSSIVTKSIIEAYQHGIKFKVIVVDSRPKLEGIEISNWSIYY